MSNSSQPTTEYTHQSINKTSVTAPTTTSPTMGTPSTDYATKPQSEKSVFEKSKETLSNTLGHITSKFHSNSSNGSGDNLDDVLVDPNSNTNTASSTTGIAGTNVKNHSPSHGHHHNYDHDHNHGHSQTYNTEYAHTPIGHATNASSNTKEHKTVGQSMKESAHHAKNKVDEYTSSTNSHGHGNSKDNVNTNYTYTKPSDPYHNGPTAVDTTKEYINITKNEKGEVVERATETVHHGKGVTTSTSHHTVASTTAVPPAGTDSLA